MSQPDWVIDMINSFNDDLREEFDERAGIMEYEGKMQRDHAECLALLCILKNNPDALIRKEEDLI